MKTNSNFIKNMYDQEFSKKNKYKYDDITNLRLYHEINQIEFSSLLEVGCGNGRRLKHLSKYFMNKNLWGLELSNTGYKHCLENNLNVLQGNAVDLPFHDNEFDVILTYHSLEQMRYIIDLVLPEFYRVCKKYVVCFEPVFKLQNIFGKYHNFKYQYVKGLPYLFNRYGFDVVDLRNLHLSRFNNRTCLLVAKKLSDIT